MLIAGLYLANTILSYFCIDLPILSTIGGMSLLPLAFFYLSSYVFKFCAYHRMFLHYIVVSDIWSYLDYWSGGFPCSDRDYLIIHLTIAGLFMYLVLYFKLRHEPINKTSPQGIEEGG